MTIKKALFNCFLTEIQSLFNPKIMKKKEVVLRTFITEKLAERNLEADESILEAFGSSVRLEEGTPDETEEIRAIKIKEDTDGKVTAKSIKLYNLMKVSYYDLFGFLIKEAAIPFVEETRAKIIFALLILLHEFYPKMAHTFNEQDARLLLLIQELGKKEFKADELSEAYQQHFDQAITTAKVSRSLNYFTDLKVLKYLNDDKYIAEEKMTYERN